MSLQRSEQKGRVGFPPQVVDAPQIGQVMALFYAGTGQSRQRGKGEMEMEVRIGGRKVNRSAPSTDRGTS